MTLTLNKVHLIGRAGRDPDVKHFESGKMVANFTLAVNRNTSNRNEPPDWFDLEVWGKTAEVAANYVKKGSLIGITGSLKFDRWKDKSTGDERQKPVILVDRLELLTSRHEQQQQQNSGYSGDDF